MRRRIFARKASGSKRSLVALLPLAALLILGLALTGQGLWIKGKAMLAQVLLEDAWEEKLAGADSPKPWPWADITPVAVLEAPSLGIRQIVLNDASGQAMAFGPGRASRAGEESALVIAGHRDTHFRWLSRLRDQDYLSVTDADGQRRIYRVLSMEIVHASEHDLPIEDGSLLLLVTCWPFDALTPGGPERYVVIAQRLGTYVALNQDNGD